MIDRRILRINKIKRSSRLLSTLFGFLKFIYRIFSHDLPYRCSAAEDLPLAYLLSVSAKWLSPSIFARWEIYGIHAVIQIFTNFTCHVNFRKKI